MKNKKLIIIVCIVLAVIVIAAIVYLILINHSLQRKLSQNITKPTSSVTTTVAASPNFTATNTITSTPEPTATMSDEQLIKIALAEKYTQSVDNVDVIISKSDGQSAFGSVAIEGEGGWFVAVKNAEGWKIIADGNSTIDCAIVDQYNVSNQIVEECFDSTSGESVMR